MNAPDTFFPPYATYHERATATMFLTKILWKSASGASVEVLSTWQFSGYSEAPGSVTSNTMSSIRKYFSGGSSAAESDRIILAPSSINPRRNSVAGEVIIQPDEFKLNGKQYVRCCGLAKPQKHTKKRTSIVWVYGEDIQLKQDPTKRFWYCYLCEGQHRQQELPISGKGNTTALDNLESKKQIDRKTGESMPTKKDPSQT